jgi:Kdo2-lipid IVA lauroyltransferase/acyltransferase
MPVLGRQDARGTAPFGRGRVAARVLATVIDGAAAIGGRVPANVAHRCAVVGGMLEWALRPRLRRRLATNLAHAVDRPPHDRMVRALVRAELVNEAKRSADLLWSISRPDEFLATMVVDGREHADRAAARGRGVLLAGIHLGGWEVAAGAPATVIPVPTTVVVADNWLAWGIQHVRVALGLKIIYRSQAALGALRVVRRGEALLVLGDDAFGPEPRTHRVQFCGVPARMPSGIVTLARLAGAPIVPFEVLPTAPRRWRIRLGPIVEPPARDSGDDGEQRVLQRLCDEWTASIRRNPAHWSARFPIAWEPPA